ncbi:zinc finger protein 831 [Trichosurus vulpecula]|uniref:zinc finger protein 831 n=1 Tax=Trichosurus vulpecula TaxID=9337 RepID=UPI00186AE20C|nr:zinc finger protein 831 [Trichosurus vulpecula]
MEVPPASCSATPATNQPVQTLCLQASHSKQTAPHLTGPVILQPEQSLPPTVYLKALTIPLYHPVQAGGFQPSHSLVASGGSFSLDSSNLPLILSPLLQSERTEASQPRKPQTQTLTVNIVGALPVLSPAASCSSTTLGSPGKSRNAGKYLCQHCGRDCLKPSVLEKHIRSHTGERPFPCTTCGIAFKTQSNLYKHRRTQTHINNARLSSESDNSSLLEDGDRLGETLPQPSTTEQSGEEKDVGEEERTLEITTSPSTLGTGQTGPSALNSFSFKSLETKSEISPGHGSALGALDKEAPLEPPHRASPGLLPVGMPQRWKMQEQRSPTASKHSQLQRQQATYSEKHWDVKVSEGKLKKCESTDSGYLSRSDSVEQQVLSASPLHSLSEHSVESENDPPELPKGMASTGTKVHLGERAAALMLEKKKLEEHISKLISHNKAVVDDTQLDNVRPRKTILSKQGSIDLPMPYTYKDSFHFDIRSLNTTRKKNITLCSVKSTYTPLEKSKPLFFHSVPTQFSTTVDCVPVTRSNSLPFVEGTRTFQERAENPWASCLSKRPPSPGSSHHLHGDSSGSVPRSVDFPSSHPRALVRQVAVEDLPLSHPTDNQTPTEDHNGGKKLSGEGTSVRCKVAGKKFSQRKLKMFSQEKWQMYGDETFKKIYQKMKTSQSIKKPRETRLCDTRNLGSDRKEAEGGEGMAGPRDTRASTCGGVILSPQIMSPLGEKVTEPDPVGHQQAQEVSLSENEHKETSQLLGSGAHPRVNRAGSSPTLSCSIPSNMVNHVGSQKPLPAPNAKQSVVQQMLREACAPCPHALSAGDRKSFIPISQDSSTVVLDQEAIPPSDGEDKEGCQWAQVVLRLHSCSPGKTLPESEKLPSERKKLKVEELSSKKNWVFLESGGEGSKVLDCSSPGISSESRTDKAQQGASGLDTGPSERIKSIEGVSERKDSSEGGGAGEAMPSVSDAESVSLASFSAILGLGLTNRKYSKHSYFCDSAAVGTRRGPEPPDGSHFPSSITAASTTSGLTIPQKDNAFSPKYILQLPQEETRTELSVAMGKKQETMSLRGSKKANEVESLAGPSSLPQAECPAGALGLPLNRVTPTMASASHLSPRPVHSINILTELASGSESPRHVQPGGVGAELGDTAVGKAQASEETPGRATCCTKQVAEKKVSFTSVYTSSFLIATDIKSEGQLLRHLHSGSTTLLVTSTSGKRESSWGTSEQLLQDWELCETSSHGQEHTPQGLENSPRSLENTSICHSFESFYCHALPTQHQDSLVWPQISPTSHSGYPRSSGARGSFPSLSAEPRLTWCCLSRSLPLPAEQKEKAHSVYSSLHICDNNSGEEGARSRRDFSFLDVKNMTQAVTYGLTSGSLKTLVSSLSWGQQKQKLSRAIGAGRVSGEKVSEPEKKRGVPCRRGKAPTNPPGVSNKQKRKINPKRYKRGHLQGCVHLKASRLRKQRWAMRKQQFPPTPDGREEGKTCRPPSPDQAGPSLQGTSSGTISELSPCCEDEPKSEDNSKNNSGNFSHSVSSRSFQETDKLHAEDLPPSASECGDPSLQNTTTTSGLPLKTHGGLATAKVKPFAYDSSLNTGLLLTPSQETSKHIPIDSTSKSYLDPLGPSCLDAKGIFHLPDAVTSGSAISISLGAKSNHKTLRIHNDESQARDAAIANPLSQNMLNREPIVVGKSCSPLPEKPSSGSRVSCSASMGMTGKTQLETSPSGLSTSSLHQVTIRPRTYFSTSSYYSCGEKHGTCVDESESGKNQVTRMVTVKESIVTASPGESLNISGASSKTLKKRSLEGMRKQTRVEYSDTSSDDEDRLVIEL